jgi:hypothetical protein
VGCSPVEVAADIAINTMARDMEEVTFLSKMEVLCHGSALIEVMNECKNDGIMTEDELRNNASAIMGVTQINEEQKAWIAKVLGAAPDWRLANSRISYDKHMARMKH